MDSKILLLALLMTITLSQHNFTLFKNLTNPNNFKDVVYLPHYHMVMLYGQSSNTATVYRTFDWVPVTDQIFTDLKYGPSYIEHFMDGVHESNLILCDSEGRIRQKSFSSAGYTSYSLWSIDGNQTKVMRATASSDGKLFAAYTTGNIVYIGNLSATDSVFETRDYSDLGIVESISWLPGTHSLYIAGGVIHEKGDEIEQGDNYLKIYDVDAQTQEDISFITHGKVMDMSFSQNGKKLYYISEVIVAEGNDQVEQTIWVHDIFSKGVQPFVTIIANVLESVNARGNYISAFDGDSQFIWSIDGTVITKQPSSSPYSGLAPQSSVYVSFTGQSQSSVYLLCQDLQHYYKPSDDSCNACPQPCDICFQQGAKCGSCLSRFYLLPDYSCGSCLANCVTCYSNDTCQQCDTNNNFMLQDNKCVCADGFELDDAGTSCTQAGSNHLVLIIIIVVAALLVVILIVFCVKRYKKNKAKKIENSLTSEPLEDYEKVSD